MDATIYQILFGELGDLNCSLIDAFQDTFLENASLSLLSTDGKTLLLFLLFFLVLNIQRYCVLDEGSYSQYLFIYLFYFYSKVYIAMQQPMRSEPAGRGAAPGEL